VRLALGATADGVVRAVVLRAARRVAVGVGLGALAVLPLAGDAVSLAAAAAVLVAVALLAAWIPARRAAAIDPANALRHA